MKSTSICFFVCFLINYPLKLFVCSENIFYSLSSTADYVCVPPTRWVYRTLFSEDTSSSVSLTELYIYIFHRISNCLTLKIFRLKFPGNFSHVFLLYSGHSQKLPIFILINMCWFLKVQKQIFPESEKTHLIVSHLSDSNKDGDKC